MAEVLDILIQNNILIQKVVTAVDCGIVVNPESAAKMGAGGRKTGSAMPYMVKCPSSMGCRKKIILMPIT